MTHARTLLLLLPALLAAPLAQAQERAAQMNGPTTLTWAALTAQVSKQLTLINQYNSSLDRVVYCGKTGMVYAPGVGGSDANGCMAAMLPPDVINALKTVTTNATNESIVVANILNCNAAGQVYNAAGNSCGSIIKPVNVVKVLASSQAISGNGKYASYATATCPNGTTLISCMGARNPSITDTCDEGKCGYIGTGPTSGNTCMTTVDDDTGTRATVWATCLKTN